jgi:hypothetical protein
VRGRKEGKIEKVIEREGTVDRVRGNRSEGERERNEGKKN